MDDLQLLALSLHDAAGLTFSEALLRSALDFASPLSHQRMLVGLRWHFLLGTLPLPTTSLDAFQSACEEAHKSLLDRWHLACAKRVAAPSAAHSASDTHTRNAPPVPRQRLAKFDSSSSSSSDTGDEDACRGGGGVSWECSDARYRVPTSSRLAGATLPCPQRASAPAAAAGSRPVENPLCPADESQYAVDFQVGRVRKEIQKDVDRLHWELPLFEDPNTRRDISEILLTYCLAEGRQYKQGLHEIAAFLYYVGFRDRSLLSLGSDGESDADSHASHADHESILADDGTVLRRLPALEQEALNVLVHIYRKMSSRASHLACTYALFRQVMAASDDAVCGGGFGLEAWYYTASELQKPHDTACVRGDSPAATFLSEQTGVVLVAERVQQDLLLLHDASLQHRLDSDYGVQGATYLIRWLRLLFLREFSLGQGVVVWTALFAEMQACRLRGRTFDLQVSLALHLATAMLLHIRDDLMKDSTHALQRLMRYPPVGDVRLLLGAAVRASTNPLLHVYATVSQRIPPSPSMATGHTREGSPSQGEVRTASLDGRSGLRGSPSALEAAPATEVMARQGARLSRIVSRLEQYWFPSPAATATEEQRARAMDEYVQSIAELKKVRDVLLFGVDD